MKFMFKQVPLTLALLLCLLAAVTSACGPASAPVAGKTAAAMPAAVNTSQGLMQQTWQENYALYQKIFAHPYNQELLKGTLNETVFRDYVIQDYHFCRNYRLVHGILEAKAPDSEGARFMAKIMGDIDAEVKALHTACISKYNISEAELTAPPAYPSTELYNSYLVKTATLEPFEVGLMATMPCHWVYYQVGADMKKIEKVQGNRYQAWIDQYGNTPWEDSGTKKTVDLAEKYMQAANPETRLRMKQAFSTAMKLEYMFWDGVYTRAKWIE